MPDSLMFAFFQHHHSIRNYEIVLLLILELVSSMNFLRLTLADYSREGTLARQLGQVKTRGKREENEDSMFSSIILQSSLMMVSKYKFLV
jgi:hypothetical protein